MTQAGLVIWLTVLWLVLWRDVSTANVVSGVVAGVVVTSVFPGTERAPRRHTLSPLWVVVFFFHALWKLIEANLLLAWEILTPRDHTRSGIIGIEVEGVSDLVVTLIANVITLTPGTVTLEIRRHPTTLYLHVLHLRDPEDVRRDVERFERLALRAMGAERDSPKQRVSGDRGGG